MSRRSRREFVGTAAAAGAALMIVPRHVLGRGFQAPSDLVNVATVGINGQGAINTRAVMSQNVVAMCDCDLDLLDGRLAQWARPAEGGGRQGGTGRQGGRGGRGGRGGAAAPPGPGTRPGAAEFRNFGPSKAQLDANARWPAGDGSANLQRFLDQQLPRLQKYRDYREMLDKQKDIDAVIVATPDHMHAVIASNAMDLGKHVYVQKPLCWSVHEARHLARKAAEKKVMAQMGNQRHSVDDNRRAVEYIRAGAIGDVREIHVWTNRPFGFWPQGVPRPAALPGDPSQLRWDDRGLTHRIAAVMKGDFRVPDRLSWDLFLGVAPVVEYHPLYHPFNWRGWVDWGQGALGDMGAHLVDFPVWALELGLPSVIETESTPFNGASYPDATTTYYELPSKKGAVKLTWYDGGLMPPDPPELQGGRLNPGGGILYVGKKGKLLQDGGFPRLLPASKHNSYGAPRERLVRVPHEDHEMNWINAIKDRDQLSCDFQYSAHLTEIMLLGIVALRANSRLHYDAASMRVTNSQDANQFLSREYREGYSL
ncbi:MAG TPA: Gfo/Idh/MocA family oxidoreductase [Vicinamibacterales bacterium]|nr:Gfo/Idh/MocA family oxidoreductase [Vicinamibacterales bacterium]